MQAKPGQHSADLFRRNRQALGDAGHAAAFVIPDLRDDEVGEILGQLLEGSFADDAL